MSQEPWLIELEECASTNTWALERHAALADGACVFTRRQTAGRGRGGATWVARDGVLTASFVVRLAQGLPQIALAAGLAVCHAIDDACPGLRVQVKWPNDVVLPIGDGLGKLGGILCERPAGSEVVVIGVGLNVHAQWDGDRECLLLATSGRARGDAVHGPTSLSEHVAASPAVRALLAPIRRYVLEAAGMLRDGRWQALAADWSRRDALLGRRIEVADGDRLHRGIMRGVAADGSLALEDDAGAVRSLASGSVVRLGAWA